MAARWWTGPTDGDRLCHDRLPRHIGRQSVAMAMIETPYAEKGSEVAVKVRKKTFPATVTAKEIL